MLSATVPGILSQHIAHARSRLRRAETVRALDACCALLKDFHPAQLLQKPRLEVEANIWEIVAELNRQPDIKKFLLEMTKSDKVHLTYASGQEAKLLSMLQIIHKGLALAEGEKGQAETQNRRERLEAMWEKGSQLVKNGETVKGKALLRRLTDEYKEEPGLLTRVGDFLRSHKLYMEASDAYALAIELFPKESTAYGGLVACYIELMEFAKAEDLYNLHMQQFGRSARTMVNLARLYLQWGKRAKAEETVFLALDIEPENGDAKELLARIERKQT